jgi:hypothetical protein
MLRAVASQAGVSDASHADLRHLARDAGVSSELARLATFWSPRGWSAARIRGAAESGDWTALDAACRDAHPRATSPAAASSIVCVVWARAAQGSSAVRFPGAGSPSP